MILNILLKTTQEKLRAKTAFFSLLAIFFSLHAGAQNFEWAKNIGGNGTEWRQAVAVDVAGNVYVTRRFNQAVDFDPGTGTTVLSPSGSNEDAFLVKLMCNDTSSSHITDSVDCGEHYMLNGQFYTTSGAYTQIFANAAGCDSTITFYLTVRELRLPSITANGYKLMTQPTHS